MTPPGSAVPLPPTAYLEHLRAESARFRAALAGCDPAAPVPTCPGWTADDLLWHLGSQVQGFWAWVVEHRPEGPDGWTEPPRPDSHAGVLAAFDEHHARLAAALGSADPAAEAWTWSEDHRVGFVLRRQAHEALVHRVDAELTAGRPVTEPDVALAVDGVAETIGVMFGACPPWGTITPLPEVLRIDLTDAGSSLWVRLGRFTGTDPDDGTSHDEPDVILVPDPGGPPDAVLAGAAAAVDLWLWKRGDDAALRTTGDASVHERFRAAVSHPID